MKALEFLIVFENFKNLLSELGEIQKRHLDTAAKAIYDSLCFIFEICALLLKDETAHFYTPLITCYVIFVEVLIIIVEEVWLIASYGNFGSVSLFRVLLSGVNMNKYLLFANVVTLFKCSQYGISILWQVKAKTKLTTHVSKKDV